MKQKLKHRIRNYFLKQKLLKQNIQCNYVVDKDKSSILIIDTNIPEYDKDSGSRRLLLLIKLMLKNNFTVLLFADLMEYRYQSDYIKAFQSLGVHVYNPCINENGDLLTRSLFITSVAQNADFVWLHRPDIFGRYIEFIKSNLPNAKIIFDMVDFHYLRLNREWELNNNPKTLKRANKYLDIELHACKNADEIILISSGDKVALKKYDVDLSKSKVLSNLHEYIIPGEGFNMFEQRKDLLFIGGFLHEPNEDAVLFLYDEIMPLVWKALPEVKVNIIGSYVPEKVLNLQSDKFIVHGFVNQVEPYFNSTRLFVAPLRYGAGIKGKIGQSLENSLPLVTTDIGAEGFDFGNFKQDMVANNPKEIAEKIISIYNDSEKWQSISKYSKTILEPFSLKQAEKTLMEILKS